MTQRISAGLQNWLLFVLREKPMRNKLFPALCALTLIAGCAAQPPTAATIAALSTELDGSKVVVDSDCIFSAPVQNQYIAYRVFGLCLFNDRQLRLYYRGDKPPLAFSWPITAIKSWALHENIFTVVTEAGNFGLVLNDANGFKGALRAQGVPENDKLPLYRAKDSSPFTWM